MRPIYREKLVIYAVFSVNAVVIFKRSLIAILSGVFHNLNFIVVAYFVFLIRVVRIEVSEQLGVGVFLCLNAFWVVSKTIANSYVVVALEFARFDRRLSKVDHVEVVYGVFAVNGVDLPGQACAV